MNLAIAKIPKDQATEAAEYYEGKLNESIDLVIIETEEDCANANRAIKDCASIIKEIDDKRFSITRPIDEAKKAVLALFGPIRERWAGRRTGIIGMVKAYNTRQEALRLEAVRKQEAERREAERKQAEEAEKLKAEAEKLKDQDNAVLELQRQELLKKAEAVKTAPVVAPTTIVPSAPKVDKRVIRTSYMAEIVDIAKVPRKYLIADMPALNKLARTFDGDNAMAPEGVQFVEKI